MNILIICDCFPPDTIVGGKRPYMFAKYLTEFGHNVTVIRSGKISVKADHCFDIGNRKFKVISCFGKNSPAELFEKGNYIEVPPRQNTKTKGKSIKYGFKLLFKIYTNIKSISDIFQSKRNYRFYKATIDSLNTEQFDIVFSTYSPLECVFAGEYAMKVFHAKWIMDFRDPIVQPNDRTFVWNKMLNPLQKRVVHKADAITAASFGFGTMLTNGTRAKRVEIIHNGFDIEIKNECGPKNKDRLIFSYAGTLYDKQVEPFTIMINAIKKLITQGIIDRSKLSFVYAGNSGIIIKKILEQFELVDILQDAGYLTKKELSELQKNTDVCVVLSWNYKKYYGVMPAKFYDGISSKKPILSLVCGDTMCSELWQMNQKYHYGFCYESAQHDLLFSGLCDFIHRVYTEKIISHNNLILCNDELLDDFRYSTLSKKLETLCKNLTGCE